MQAAKRDTQLKGPKGNKTQLKGQKGNQCSKARLKCATYPWSQYIATYPLSQYMDYPLSQYMVMKQQSEMEMRHLPAISIYGYVWPWSQYMVMWATEIYLRHLPLITYNAPMRDLNKLLCGR